LDHFLIKKWVTSLGGKIGFLGLKVKHENRHFWGSEIWPFFGPFLDPQKSARGKGAPLPLDFGLGSKKAVELGFFTILIKNIQH
jgi:hypothetical protein